MNSSPSSAAGSARSPIQTAGRRKIMKAGTSPFQPLEQQLSWFNAGKRTFIVISSDDTKKCIEFVIAQQQDKERVLVNEF